MKDFASYCGSEPPSHGGQSMEDLSRMVKDAIAEYGSKGEGELVKAIYARALEGKRNGTLTNEQLDAFCEQISPLLDGTRRKKLVQIVEKLKRM